MCVFSAVLEPVPDAVVAPAKDEGGRLALKRCVLFLIPGARPRDQPLAAYFVRCPFRRQNVRVVRQYFEHCTTLWFWFTEVVAIQVCCRFYSLDDQIEYATKSAPQKWEQFDNTRNVCPEAIIDPNEHASTR